jgi:ABC-type sugar transport system, periplasmic component
MKKVFAMLVCLLLVMSSVSFASASAVMELEYIIHKSESEAIEGMQKVIDMFNAANPDIHITLTPTPDFGTVIQTRAQTNEMPDLFSCTTNNLYEIMFEDGLIMDLTGQAFLENVEAETLALSTYKDKNWRLPYSLSCYGLYIRTDIFEEHGIEWPTTWEELMAVCDKLNEAGITPFVVPDKSLSMVAQRLERMMGIIDSTDDEFKDIAAGEVKPEDSKVLTTFAKAFVDIANNTTPESLGAEMPESYQDLIANKAAMTINGTWSLATMKSYDENIKVALVPLPNPAGGDAKVPVSIDTSFCISSSTKYPEACLRFLDFLSKTETAQVYTDIECSPNVILGVEYNVPEFASIVEKLNAGDIFISLNAIWPSGFRNDLRDPAQMLIIDKNIDAFINEAGRVIDEYYNN